MEHEMEATVYVYIYIHIMYIGLYRDCVGASPNKWKIRWTTETEHQIETRVVWGST